MTEPSGGSAPGTRVLQRFDDRDLVALLQEQGCRGVLWVAAIDALARYSWHAFERVLRSGALRSRTRNRGREIHLSPPEWHELLADHELRQELFLAALQKQIALFAARTCDGCGWIDGGRMSLRDYFFNGVLLQLANPVRAWRRRRQRDLRVELLPPEDYDLVMPADPRWAPEEEFLATESAATVMAALDRADPRLRAAILLRADTGAQWRHIAPQVGLTEDALDGLRRRFKQSLVQRAGHEG